MKYDFDTAINRKDTGSVKWDFAGDAIPMWVADMDFETFPGIKKKVMERAAHGIYGYTHDTASWSDAYKYWWKTRHGFEIDADWLVFVTGIVPAISSAVRKLTTPGENVLIQTPVYPVFFNSILNNGRQVLENRLVYDRESGSFAVDWDDLEKKLADPQTTLMILCNPQNPTGNIWDKETLIKIGELCAANHVRIVSDEIHCDVVAPGKEYTPFASVSELNRRISVTCVSPTKTFNIAGIKTAAIIVPDGDLRHKMWRGINTDEVGEGNYFAYEAAVAAFSKEGGEWLDELREYIWANRRFAEGYIKEEIKTLRPIRSDASYLMWVDCGDVTDDTEIFVEHLKKNAKVMFSYGEPFGGKSGTFIRINLACPGTMLEEALQRLKKGTAGFGRA
ncbi:MAG: pyridoxal phosphate-dependent aminotransferase [Lachnospiraceae bacterium]|nr:pyridoxal phosphate-dependent aminotransferase [Lachnospiraceae bacterium]